MPHGLECVLRGVHTPVGMVFDAHGALYVAEWQTDRVVRIAPDGTRSTVLDQVDAPAGLAFDAQGGLQVASCTTGEVLRLEPGSLQSPRQDHAQCQPQRLHTDLRYPVGLHMHPAGGLLVANRDAGELLRLGAAGREVLASGLASPAGAAVLADGSVVVAEYKGRVSCIAPDGSVRTLTTALQHPAAGVVALDAQSVAVADFGGNAVHRVTVQGETTILAQGLQGPVGLAMGPDGRLYVGAWGDGAVFAITLP